MLPSNDSDTHGWADALQVARVAEYEEDIFESNELMKYLYAITLTLLFWEYFITLEREVNYAWGRRMTLAKAVFFLNRYLNLLYTLSGFLSASLPATFFVRPSNMITRLDDCILLTRLMDTITAVLYIVLAIFSGLRVDAIGRHNKLVTSLVGLLALVPLVTNITFDVFVHPAILPAGSDFNYLPFAVCIAGEQPAYLDTISNRLLASAVEVLTRAVLILSEGIVLLVIVIQAASMYRQQRHLMSLTTLICREGIVYFLASMVQDALFLVTAIKPDIDILFLIRTVITIIPPILISRFYFHLDEWDRVKHVKLEGWDKKGSA
ncbi:hypothetical protein C8Q74DRAFT_1363045 [Fomes fomentarius]|nr:hypothetical protein C8Q74DRAFT_1363045 [Fomes fomentarius]